MYAARKIKSDQCWRVLIHENINTHIYAVYTQHTTRYTQQSLYAKRAHTQGTTQNVSFGSFVNLSSCEYWNKIFIEVIENKKNSWTHFLYTHTHIRVRFCSSRDFANKKFVCVPSNLSLID